MVKRAIVPWMLEKSTQQHRGDGVFRLSAIEGASTARVLMRGPRAPQPLKNLEVMNDEITTTAAGPEP